MTILQLPFAEENADEMASRTKLVDSLKTALRTQPHSFVLRFVELGGLPSLLNALHSMDEQTAHCGLHNAYIGCIKALMNNSVHAVKNRGTVRKIVSYLEKRHLLGLGLTKVLEWIAMISRDHFHFITPHKIRSVHALNAAYNALRGK